MYKTATILLFAYIVVASVAQYQNALYVNNKIETYETHIWQLQSMLMKSSVASPDGIKLVSRGTARSAEQAAVKVLTVTAYTPSEDECGSDPFITASNRKVREGIVAVSRDLFNQGWIFGKRVYIRDHGVFVIDDLMADSKRQCLDILMFKKDSANEFGKKKLEVFLLDA